MNSKENTMNSNELTKSEETKIRQAIKEVRDNILKRTVEHSEEQLNALYDLQDLCDEIGSIDYSDDTV